MASRVVLADYNRGADRNGVTCWKPVFEGMVPTWHSLGVRHKIVDGSPFHGWGVCRIVGTPAQLAAVVALPNVDAFPAAFASLDTPLSVLTTVQMTNMVGRLIARGLTQATGYSGTTLVRRVVRDLIQMHEPLADESAVPSWP